MGIDAEMLIDVPKKLTEEHVLSVSRRLVSMFGVDHFYFKDQKYDRETDKYVPSLTHALEIIQEDYEDSYRTDHELNLVKGRIIPFKGHTLVKVHLASRYYGPGYERGNYPLIYNVGKFLEASWPQGRVWYGGDSSGVKFERFDGPDGIAETIWDHMVKVAREPYLDVFDGPLGGSEIPKPPPCARCKIPLKQCGWGPKYGLFSCSGCGLTLLTKDGGKTYVDRRVFQQESARKFWDHVRAILFQGAPMDRELLKEHFEAACYP